MENEENKGFVEGGKGANPSTTRYRTSAAGRIRTCDLPVSAALLG